MSKFSDRLKALRAESGLSQAEFAKSVGCTKSSINMYERGEREPGLEKLEAFADFFNVDMDFLLGKCECRKKTAWLRSTQSEKHDTPSLTEPHDVQYIDDSVVEFVELLLQLSPEQRTILYDFICAIKNMTDNQTLDDLAAEYKKMLSELASKKGPSASNITGDGPSNTKISEG